MDVILKNGMKYSKKEKERLIAVFREHKGYYMVMSSGITKHKSHAIFNALSISYNLFVLIYNVYVMTFVVFDMSIAIECLFFCFITLCGVTFMCCLYCSKIHFQEIIRKLSEGVYHYGDTLDPQTAHLIKEMTDKMKKRKMLFMNAAEIVFTFAFFFSFFLLPLVSGKFTRKPELNEKYGNMLEGWYFNGQSAVIGYRQYETESWAGWIFSTTWEYYIATSVFLVLVGTDIPFIGFSEESCNQMEILNLTLRNILPRARYVHKKKYGKEVNSYGDKKFTKCLELCLNDSARHHVASNGYFNDILHAYSSVIFFIYGTGSVLICTAGLVFASSRVDLALKIAFLLWISGAIVHLFIFSYYGEKLSDVSCDTRAAIYESEWPEVSKAMKPYVIMIQSITNTSLTLKSGGLINCNFDTFGNVLSTAYSYFNILRASTNF